MSSVPKPRFFGRPTGGPFRSVHRKRSCRLLPSSPLVPILKRWGFRGRESAPFVIATTEGGKWDGLVNNETGWFLTHGDRDA